MQRSERLFKLLELLHDQAGMDAGALSRLCGISARTLQRDLDALGEAGFPVYFDRGYRLAAPALLPPITLTVDQALALRLAAEAARPKAEPAAARSLTGAVQRLEQTLAAKPPERPAERQLSLGLTAQDPRREAIAVALGEAIALRRTVKLTYRAAAGEKAATRRMDPYRLLPVDSDWRLLGYCHARRRILEVPLGRLAEVAVQHRRFQPLPARVLERHLHRAEPDSPQVHWVRLACYPPLAQAFRKRPPIGSLMWEEGAEGSLVYTLAVLRPEDLIPWILSCGDGVEVLAPATLRREVCRIARAVAARTAQEPTATPAA